MNARKLPLFVASVAAAVGLSACVRSANSGAAVTPEVLTPISRVYVVDSSEVVEISRFEDGSVRYTPSGWLVISTPAEATATASAGRQLVPR